MPLIDYVRLLGLIISGLATLGLAIEITGPKYPWVMRVVGGAIFAFGGNITLLVAAFSIIG